MIRSKREYREYLKADRAALGVTVDHPLFSSNNSMVWLTDPIYKWEKLLRRVEYWKNCHGSCLWLPVRLLLRWRFQRLSTRLGFSIPINVVGPGLKIMHYGSIVISRHARIGCNCVLNSCVNIGVNPSSREGAPHIGNNVYVGPGAKLWNDITIGDDITIGANSCVSKSVMTPGSTVVGVNRILSRKS